MTDSVILFGPSALEYWRGTKGAAAGCETPPAIQKAILRPSYNDSSRRLAEAAKELQLASPLHISVPEPKQRRGGVIVNCHIWREIPGLPPCKEIAPGVLAPTPAVALAQMAATLDYIDLLLLTLELLGCYALSPSSDEGFVATSSPLTTIDELNNVAAALSGTGIAGSALLGDALKLAAEGSKSPMESKLYTFLSTPRRRGGFGIEGILLNLKVSLDRIARMHLDLGGIRPDLYLPRGQSAIEYQSRLHPDDARENDERRSDALTDVGIRVFQLNRVRVRDLRDLSGVAYVMAKRAGIRRPKPSLDVLQKRKELHSRLFFPYDMQVNQDPGHFEALLAGATSGHAL